MTVEEYGPQIVHIDHCLDWLRSVAIFHADTSALLYSSRRRACQNRRLTKSICHIGGSTKTLRWLLILIELCLLKKLQV
ncbi:hypothetical protein HD806DRAFT_250729 [Xylariaceae sp. AK1471]|nr:hypothetical protein HD806DRAFT_250729 [Xylariaceae sp. AK1471]